MCLKPKVPKAPSEKEVLAKQEAAKNTAAEKQNKASALALARNPKVTQSYLGIVDDMRF